MRNRLQRPSRRVELNLCAVVLVKDLDAAKQRLNAALSPAERSNLARENAVRALNAARAVAPRLLAVACGESALAIARESRVEVVEDECRGQNAAARAGIERAVAIGADAVLLLSSDLPLLDARALEKFLATIRPGRLAVAGAAQGRGGTNLLYMSPPDALGLHFGDQSLPKFERDARDRGIPFLVYDAPELALDVDEPSDLEALAQATARA